MRPREVIAAYTGGSWFRHVTRLTEHPLYVSQQCKAVHLNEQSYAKRHGECSYGCSPANIVKTRSGKVLCKWKKAH